MKKRNYITVVLLLLVPLMLTVDLAYSGSETRVGTAGASEIIIPVGSRGSALSGSINALASGVEAIYWNPAGVSNQGSVEAMFSSLSYIADIKLNYFAISSSFGDAGTFGFAIRSLSFGDIPITTTALPEGTGGTYSPNFITGSLTYSRAFTDRIHGGFTVKMISENIVRTSAVGVAFDFGVQYISKDIGLKLGVAMKNLGPNMTYDGPDMESFVSIPGQEPGSRQRALRLPGASFELPSTLEIGLGYDYKVADQHMLTFAGDFQNTNFGNDEYRMGVEYGFNNMFFVRGGYMLFGKTNDDNIYGPTFGAGINIPVEGSTIILDYAYRHAKYFDANQWFTIKLAL
ncbi:MAG: PorV/PorQ family protein [Ignavibacteriales bacterium]|nr:PorV/PorQ family protein [Ignavibacteriales bacterium]